MEVAFGTSKTALISLVETLLGLVIGLFKCVCMACMALFWSVGVSEIIISFAC